MELLTALCGILGTRIDIATSCAVVYAIFDGHINIIGIVIACECSSNIPWDQLALLLLLDLRNKAELVEIGMLTHSSLAMSNSLPDFEVQLHLV